MTSTNKTIPTPADVATYIAKLADQQQRSDASVLCDLMQNATGQPPVMWGPSIIGFGLIHYKYDSGREGDMPAVGFAARKGTLVIYGLGAQDHPDDIARLGKLKTGKGCVYVKSLATIDQGVLSELIAAAYAQRSNGLRDMGRLS